MRTKNWITRFGFESNRPYGCPRDIELDSGHSDPIALFAAVGSRRGAGQNLSFASFKIVAGKAGE
jgi:hypothetical protein